MVRTWWSPKFNFESFVPRPKAEGWTRMKQGVMLAKMILLPVNKDIPATHWECTKCKRQITLSEREAVFADQLQLAR